MDLQAPSDLTQTMQRLLSDLQQRGQVALFPHTWSLHFIYLPQRLFFNPHQPAIISPLLHDDKSDDFRAKVAFERLAVLGGRVRDSMEASISRPVSYAAQYLVEAECRHYLAWAFSSLYRMDPRMARRIVIVTARTRADPHEDCAMRCEEVLMRIKQEVQEQEQERESEDEEEGTCFGIAISGPIVALVALNCGQHAAPVRTLHVCDFSDPDGDVWEAIALALHIIHARNDHYRQIQRLQTDSLQDQYANIHIR